MKPMMKIADTAPLNRRDLTAGKADAPSLLRIVASADGDAVDGYVDRGEYVVIGRDPGPKGFAMDDPMMSRAHLLVVRRDDGSVHFEDLGSTNGTFLNGEPCDAHRLEPGDVLRAGSSLFVLTRKGPSADVEDPSEGVIGDAPAFREACARSILGASSQFPILLLGETGTGKDVLARVVHRASGRKGAYLPLNCGAIPSELVDATLFGHERGAFTGASESRRGLFREASDGTLFLDEVGDLPLPVQARLLRALDQKEILPVGASRPVRVDCAVVAATNVNLEEAVAEGRFRADLFARLSAWRVDLPALRSRKEDILRLVRHFAGDGFDTSFSDPLVDADLAEALLVHDWAYNVRELKQVVGGLAVHAKQGGRPSVEDLPEAIQQSYVRARSAGAELRAVRTPPSQDNVTLTGVATPGRPRRRRPAKAELSELLISAGWNISAVARHYDRDRKQIYRWMERYGLEPPAE